MSKDNKLLDSQLFVIVFCCCCCKKWCPYCLEVKYVICLFCCPCKPAQRSVASVQWIGIHKKNQYRVGHRGKVRMLVSIHYQSLILFCFHVSLLLVCVATCSVGATWQLVSSKVQYDCVLAPILITFWLSLGWSEVYQTRKWWLLLPRAPSYPWWELAPSLT